MNKKRVLRRILVVIIILVLAVLASRNFGIKEIDDVNPYIDCDEEMLNSVDVLWIIPKFNDEKISWNQEWCDWILSLNKTLGLHGVYHTYNEFGVDRNQDYLQEGIDIFKECFGFKPKMFKAPQLNMTRNNRILINENNMELKSYYNQFVHKVYHCNVTKKSMDIPNRIVGFFIKSEIGE